MNARYIEKLTPKKREQQMRRAVLHKILPSHRNGYGSLFSLENQLVSARVSRAVRELNKILPA